MYSFRILGLAILSIVGFSILPSQAQTTGEKLCGGTYTIVAGDTLSLLSKRVYGSLSDFLRFYEDERNARSLGKNPNRIGVGDTLYLPPCPGQEASIGEIASPDQPVDEFAAPIYVVTGSDYAPFTDEGMRDGGMLTRVVNEAFGKSGLKRNVRIHFINDWGAHLNPLVSEGKYDYGFPWFRPDCSDRLALSEGMRIRCDFEWSDPLFSVTIGFYGLATLQNPPQSFSDVRGLRLCRPSGYFTFDLEAEGLVPGDSIVLETPTGVADCFEMLRDGKVDLVTINRFTAERAIAEAGLGGLILPIQTIVTTQDLHLIAHKSNSDAVRQLRGFNTGLQALKNEGRFNQIVRVFLDLHQKTIQEIEQVSN